MSDDTLRLPYRVEATDPHEAIEKAKAVCRAEGWTIRTIANCRESSSVGQWVVTIIVRSKVAA